MRTVNHEQNIGMKFSCWNRKGQTQGHFLHGIFQDRRGQDLEVGTRILSREGDILINKADSILICIGTTAIK